MNGMQNTMARVAGGMPGQDSPFGGMQMQGALPQMYNQTSFGGPGQTGGPGMAPPGMGNTNMPFGGPGQTGGPGMPAPMPPGMGETGPPGMGAPGSNMGGMREAITAGGFGGQPPWAGQRQANSAGGFGGRQQNMQQGFGGGNPFMGGQMGGQQSPYGGFGGNPFMGGMQGQQNPMQSMMQQNQMGQGGGNCW